MFEEFRNLISMRKNPKIIHSKNEIVINLLIFKQVSAHNILAEIIYSTILVTEHNTCDFNNLPTNRT